jgi:arsenate reductase
MAAGFLRADGRVQVLSAGSAPGEVINATAVSAMAELGIDIADQRPTGLTMDMAQTADIVITMGCGDACPVFPGKRYVDWDLADPAGQDLEVVRAIRDDIASRVRGLLEELFPSA